MKLMIVKEFLKRDDFSLLLPTNIPKYIQQSLSYFEIKHITKIKPDEFLHIEKLLLPYYLAGSGHIHPLRVAETKSYLISKIGPQVGTGRVYVSRSRQRTRRIINERGVMEVVKHHGFTIVHFEDLNFEEQVKLAQSSSIMISSHGANLTNLMFMPQNAFVLEFIRKEKPNFCYWALANVTGVNYYYQLCSIGNEDHLIVDIEVFKTNLNKILNSQNIT